MNRRLRPKRSVSWPKIKAPTHAPAMYSEAAQPDICAAVRPTPAPGSDRRPEIELTTLTSNPSRIQAVPSPATIIQWKRAHGNRSNRAGTFVSIVPVSTLSLIVRGSL
jgi:hypothetical protein